MPKGGGGGGKRAAAAPRHAAGTAGGGGGKGAAAPPRHAAGTELHKRFTRLLFRKGGAAELQALLATECNSAARRKGLCRARLEKPAAYAGWSPLHCAAVAGRLKVLKLLKDLGADMAAREVSGKTAFELAAMHGQHELVGKSQQGVWKGAAMPPRPDLHCVSARDIAMPPRPGRVHWSDVNQRRLRLAAKRGDLKRVHGLSALVGAAVVPCILRRLRLDGGVGVLAVQALRDDVPASEAIVPYAR